jgi:hypothetical protein
MKRFTKGEAAKPGFYLDIRHLDFIQVTGDSLKIPEAGEGSYIKVHGIIAAIIMAIMGLFIVLFLPFAAIVGLVAILTGGRRRASLQPKPTHKQIQ